MVDWPIHFQMYTRSLAVLFRSLRRDMYQLNHPGILVNEIKPPNPDPLRAVRYACIYWVDHLYDCHPEDNAASELQDGGSVDKFLHRSYLYWLEALGFLRSVPEGILAMGKVGDLLQVRLLHPHAKAT